MKKILIAMIAFIGLANAGEIYTKDISTADELLCKAEYFGTKLPNGNRYDMRPMNDIEQRFFIYKLSNEGKTLTSGSIKFTYKTATVAGDMVFKSHDDDVFLELVRAKRDGNPLYNMHSFVGKDSKFYGHCITMTQE